MQSKPNFEAHVVILPHYEKPDEIEVYPHTRFCKLAAGSCVVFTNLTQREYLIEGVQEFSHETESSLRIGKTPKSVELDTGSVNEGTPYEYDIKDVTTGTTMIGNPRIVIPRR